MKKLEINFLEKNDYYNFDYQFNCGLHRSKTITSLELARNEQLSQAIAYIKNYIMGWENE